MRKSTFIKQYTHSLLYTVQVLGALIQFDVVNINQTVVH